METINASELYQYILGLGNVINILDMSKIHKRVKRPIVRIKMSYLTKKGVVSVYEQGTKFYEGDPTPIHEYKKYKLFRIIDGNELIDIDITVKEDMSDINLVNSENDKINTLLDCNIHEIFERNIKDYKLFRDLLSRDDYGVERSLVMNKIYQIVSESGRRFINFKKFDRTLYYDTEPEFLLSELTISFHQYSDNVDKSKAFDFITVTIPVIRRDNSNEQIINKFKSEKSRIYDVMMKKIQSRSQYKQFKVPFNYFRCTKLTLRRDDIMEFTFEIKEI